MVSKYKGIDKAAARIALRASKLAREAVQDPKLAKKLRDRIILGIRKSSLLPSGQPVPSVGTRWKKRRNTLAMAGQRTNRWYTPGGSNLTFSGQFLNSFQAKIVRFGVSTRLIITPEGDHKGYKLVKGGQSKGAKMRDIARGQIERGADYRTVSNDLRKSLAKSVKARILKEFKLNL